MREWPKRLAALLGTSLLVPIVGELAIAMVKGEVFNMPRAAAFVGIIGGCAVALLIGKVRRLPLRLAMASFLTAAGVAISALGFLLTLKPRALTDETVADIAGMITLCVGLFILSAGLLLLSDQRGQFPEPAPEETEPVVPPRWVLRKFGPFRHNLDGIVELCKSRAAASDLQYIAYYTLNECVFRLDLFDEPEVARFHGLVTPEERRIAYERHGSNLRTTLVRLNADFREIDSGALVRLVLDVERGAIYYYVVHSETGRYLIGITLDQHQVHVTDAKMQRLVDDIRHYLGHPRIPELAS